MDISCSHHDNVVLVTLEGDALGGPDGSALHDTLHSERGEGPLQAVIDLEGVRHMNSSGLGMLIGALTTARNTGGDLRLTGASDRIQTLLRVTQLDGVFKSFDSADAAVASFEG